MKTALMTLVAFCTPCLLGCGGEVVDDIDETSREIASSSNIVKLMKDEIADVWNNKNLDLHSKYYSPKLKAQFNDDPQMNYQGHFNYVYALLNDLPDLKLTLLDIFPKGNDKLVKRYKVTGTHVGSMMGFPASNKKITFTGTGIYTFKKGKITALWNHVDMYGIIKQMGLIQ